MGLDVDVLDRKTRRDLDRLRRGVRRSGIRRSLNRTIRGVRTAASSEFRSEFNAKKRDVDRRLKVRLARGLDTEAALQVTASAMPMVAFGARQTKRGVSVRIRKGGGRQRFRHAFIARMPSGHRGVFERRTPSTHRLPIDELFSTAPVQYLDRPAVVGRLGDVARERLVRELNHEIQRRARARG